MPRVQSTVRHVVMAPLMMPGAVASVWTHHSRCVVFGCVKESGMGVWGQKNVWKDSQRSVHDVMSGDRVAVSFSFFLRFAEFAQ